MDCFPPYLSIIGRIKNNIVSITGLLLDAATTKVFACSSKEKCRFKAYYGNIISHYNKICWHSKYNGMEIISKFFRNLLTVITKIVKGGGLEGTFSKIQVEIVYCKLKVCSNYVIYVTFLKVIQPIYLSKVDNVLI